MLEKLITRMSVVLIAGALLVTGLSQSALQAQTTCTCPSNSAFGSCVVKKASYPQSYPGCVLVAEIGDDNWLYVADLYRGFTYRYDADQFLATGGGTPEILLSPQGSRSTTGVTLRKGELLTNLFWAIENELWISDLDLKNTLRTGIVQLADLAAELRIATGDTTITTGQLGGITYHPTRGKFWAVDIVNDVYFELDATGEIHQNGDAARFFFSPKKDPRGGGAYGNSITYVATADGEFFDIPVGSLTDRQPTEVIRVHAVDGQDPETFKIGDPTGVRYPLGAAVGSPEFVTGIGFWANACGEGQHVEFLLDHDSVGGSPEIIAVSADDPTASNVASLRCELTGETTVTLSWKKTLPYTKLTITRREVTLPGTTPITVYENEDFGSDPEQYDDINVPDGSFEYVATVTASQEVAPVSCRITVGNGALVAYRKIPPNGAEVPRPYAVTVAGDETVIVAELADGVAYKFDLDLNPEGTIQTPFQIGKAVGIAYGEFEVGEGQTEGRLYWIQNVQGLHTLRSTDLSGNPLTQAVTVVPPSNLSRGVSLGDIAYDKERNVFWTVDLQNERVYAFTPEGRVIDGFASAQPPAPKTGGFQSGGVALAGSSESRVTLDIPAGSAQAGFVNQIIRLEYDATDPTFAPVELFAIDVPSAIGASDLSGVAIYTQDTDTSFLYVAAQDTKTVYKLRITGPSTGGVFFRRGDANNDDQVNISDPSFLLEHLFRGGDAPACDAAADADSSDSLELTDAIYLFNYLFVGGPAPAKPFTRCGIDANATLPCDEANCTN